MKAISGLPYKVFDSVQYALVIVHGRWLLGYRQVK